MISVQQYSHNVSHEQKLSQKLQQLQRKRTKKMKGQWRQDLWKDNLLRIPMVKDPLKDSPDDHEISPETRHLNVVASSSIYDVDEQKMSPREEKKEKIVETIPPVAITVTNGDGQVTNASGQTGKLLPHQRISKFAKVNLKKKQQHEKYSVCFVSSVLLSKILYRHDRRGIF